MQISETAESRFCQQAECRSLIKSAAESKTNLVHAEICFGAPCYFSESACSVQMSKACSESAFRFHIPTMSKNWFQTRHFEIWILLRGECYRPADFRFCARKRWQIPENKMICPRLIAWPACRIVLRGQKGPRTEYMCAEHMYESSSMLLQWYLLAV